MIAIGEFIGVLDPQQVRSVQEGSDLRLQAWIPLLTSTENGLELSTRNLECFHPTLDQETDGILLTLLKKVKAFIMRFLFNNEMLVWQERADFLRRDLEDPIEMTSIESPQSPMEMAFLNGAFQNNNTEFAQTVLRSLFPQNIQNFTSDGTAFTIALQGPSEGNLQDLSCFSALSPVGVPTGAFAVLRMEQVVTGYMMDESLNFGTGQITIDVRFGIMGLTRSMMQTSLSRIQIMPDETLHLFTEEAPDTPVVFTREQFNAAFGSFSWNSAS
ncbi:MAG: hypothetical protein KAR79_04775 [Simkaniaceae bacterium]|nr:hypothetical protein [Simkaniaceae bacterium]